MDLAQLGRALEAFSAQEPTHLYVHTVQVFLEVARRGQCTYEEISEALNLTNSSVSRVINAIGHTHRSGRPGYGWVETFRDPDEGRRFLVRLTSKGEALARLIKGL